MTEKKPEVFYLSCWWVPGQYLLHCDTTIATMLSFVVAVSNHNKMQKISFLHNSSSPKNWKITQVRGCFCCRLSSALFRFVFKPSIVVENFCTQFMRNRSNFIHSLNFHLLEKCSITIKKPRVFIGCPGWVIYMSLDFHVCSNWNINSSHMMFFSYPADAVPATLSKCAACTRQERPCEINTQQENKKKFWTERDVLKIFRKE